MQNKLETKKISFLFLEYVVPAVLSMVLAGIQPMIDGLFLGRYASTNAMASVNIAVPYMQIILGCVMILCTGTISFLGRTLGEKTKSSEKKAQDIFHTSFMMWLAISAILMILGFCFNKPMAGLMGANNILMTDTSHYIFVISFFIPAIGLMILFGFTERLLGKPKLYLIAAIACLVCNIVMDFIAIRILQMGTIGAAFATGFSYVVGFLITCRPVFRKDSIINVYQGHFQPKLLLHTLYNGSSEGITSVSAAVTIWLFNLALMRYAGENGVAAFTVINYVGDFGVLIMFGVSDGIGSMVSYNYGAGHLKRVKNILYQALFLNFVIGIISFIGLNLFNQQLISIFFNGQYDIVKMAVQGARLYSFAFLLNGFNIIQSGYHTALGNAGNSILISGSRGLVFIALGMLILPNLWGIKGVWITVPFAEFCTLLVCLAITVNEKRQKKLQLS